MNSASKIAVVVLLCLIAGCKHKTQAAPPPAAQAPILPPSTITQAPPQLPPAETPKVDMAESDVAKQQPPPKPRKPQHHKPKPADQTPAQTAKDTTPTTQQASAGEPPEMSPIGQLSSAADGSLSKRHAINDQITEAEKSLNGIKRTLTADEQVTVAQIRTFLTKAKAALDQDDLDGASTLVTKAKVLLTELTKT